MKRSLAVALAVITTSLAGCGNGEATAERPTADADAGAVTAAAAAAPEPKARNTPAVRAAAVAGAGDIPTFAAIYPGAQISGSPTTAVGPDGPGGIVSFTTDADPETVVAWYRQRAEAAGLSSVMAMNQGDARAYGAAAANAAGTSLRVVADSADDGSTSVQLTWSAGR